MEWNGHEPFEEVNTKSNAKRQTTIKESSPVLYCTSSRLCPAQSLTNTRAFLGQERASTSTTGTLLTLPPPTFHPTHSLLEYPLIISLICASIPPPFNPLPRRNACLGTKPMTKSSYYYVYSRWPYITRNDGTKLPCIAGDHSHTITGFVAIP